MEGTLRQLALKNKSIKIIGNLIDTYFITIVFSKYYYYYLNFKILV